MKELDWSPSELEIEHCVEMLVPELQKKIAEKYERYKSPRQIVGKHFLSETTVPLLKTKRGRVYWKLILEHQDSFGGVSQSVFGFIRRRDGAIFKAATWRKPETRTATAIRGYVTDEHAGDYFTQHGVIYSET
jgi:hypothetical protein